MFFVGTYPLTIDGKSRLSVPFVVRDKMTSEADGKAFYVLPGRRRGTLMLFPDAYFERTRLHQYPAERITEETYAFQQFEYSQAALVEPDSQGRITIPERLRARTGIDTKVTLIGVQDHLELWDRDAFDAFEAERWDGYETARPHAMAELHEVGAFATSRREEPAGVALAEAD